jgi:hypothetical protein
MTRRVSGARHRPAPPVRRLKSERDRTVSEAFAPRLIDSHASTRVTSNVPQILRRPRESRPATGPALRQDRAWRYGTCASIWPSAAELQGRLRRSERRRRNRHCPSPGSRSMMLPWASTRATAATPSAAKPSGRPAARSGLYAPGGAWRSSPPAGTPGCPCRAHPRELAGGLPPPDRSHSA